MKIIKYNSNFKCKDNIILLCGFFETLHKGHLELINYAKHIIKNKKNWKICIMTFDVNPISVILKQPIKQFFTFKERKVLYKELGIDYIWKITFNLKIANTSYNVFINHISDQFPNLKKIICGEDFRFGKKQAGTVLDLKNNFPTTVIKILKDNENNKIGSFGIKNLLLNNDFVNIKKLLLRDYFVFNKVITGNGFGRKIGFPTINIQIAKDKLLPEHGIYAGYIFFNNKKYYVAICISNNPTVLSAKNISLEGYILDFNKNIYGQYTKLYFTDYIRKPIKYNTVSELKKAISFDVKWIRNKYEN